MHRFEDGAWTAMRLGVAVVGCLALANCSSSNKTGSRVDARYGVSASPRVVQPGEPVPKGGGVYRVGQPYMVGGRMYFPQENARYRAEGTASWYGDDFHGRLTANGEVFDMESIAAAHPTMPLPSYARVTNLANRRSIVVRVNDRGPYHGNRLIDVSKRAAEALGFHRNGTTQVRVEYIGPAPLEGSDDRRLMATLREGTPAPAPSLIRVASTRPFVPGADAPPVPAERPFDLGQTPPGAARQASAPRPRLANESATPRPGDGWLRRPDEINPLAEAPAPAPAAAPAAPVSAFAPTGYVGTQAVTSGRGLY
jgi:rare lipoprotein A